MQKSPDLVASINSEIPADLVNHPRLVHLKNSWVQYLSPGNRAKYIAEAVAAARADKGVPKFETAAKTVMRSVIGPCADTFAVCSTWEVTFDVVEPPPSASVTVTYTPSFGGKLGLTVCGAIPPLEEPIVVPVKPTCMPVAFGTVDCQAPEGKREEWLSRAFAESKGRVPAECHVHVSLGMSVGPNAPKREEPHTKALVPWGMGSLPCDSVRELECETQPSMMALAKRMQYLAPGSNYEALAKDLGFGTVWEPNGHVGFLYYREGRGPPPPTAGIRLFGGVSENRILFKLERKGAETARTMAEALALVHWWRDLFPSEYLPPGIPELSLALKKELFTAEEARVGAEFRRTACEWERATLWFKSYGSAVVRDVGHEGHGKWCWRVHARPREAGEGCGCQVFTLTEARGVSPAALALAEVLLVIAWRGLIWIGGYRDKSLRYTPALWTNENIPISPTGVDCGRAGAHPFHVIRGDEVDYRAWLEKASRAVYRLRNGVLLDFEALAECCSVKLMHSVIQHYRPNRTPVSFQVVEGEMRKLTGLKGLSNLIGFEVQTFGTGVLVATHLLPGAVLPGGYAVRWSRLDPVPGWGELMPAGPIVDAKAFPTYEVLAVVRELCSALTRDYAFKPLDHGGFEVVRKSHAPLFRHDFADLPRPPEAEHYCVGSVLVAALVESLSCGEGDAKWQKAMDNGAFFRLEGDAEHLFLSLVQGAYATRLKWERPAGGLRPEAIKRLVIALRDLWLRKGPQ